MVWNAIHIQAITKNHNLVTKVMPALCSSLPTPLDVLRDVAVLTEDIYLENCMFVDWDYISKLCLLQVWNAIHHLWLLSGLS